MRMKQHFEEINASGISESLRKSDILLIGF